MLAMNSRFLSRFVKCIYNDRPFRPPTFRSIRAKKPSPGYFKKPICTSIFEKNPNNRFLNGINVTCNMTAHFHWNEISARFLRYQGSMVLSVNTCIDIKYLQYELVIFETAKKICSIMIEVACEYKQIQNHFLFTTRVSFNYRIKIV